ncbi:glycosyltransferase family 4 protein [Parvularcula marina]|uniref:Glycosyltransferase family 1 protein n=1 Tax=Parvularcula marina TaxID=2292771 RepID=A0A371RF36_9PROT|nr:glycosyltransferase family 4 protein [Parvularcula marina]RFB04069.1 glycosyltransferase family 1 protein [Parvularcula marina]
MRLHWVFSTFAIGGPQRRFAALAHAMGEEAEHFITAMDGCYTAESLLDGVPSCQRHEVEVQKTGFISPGNVKRFRASLNEVDADLLLTSNWGTIEWTLANTRAKPMPHLHFEDGFGPDEALGKWNWKRDLARRFLFSRIFSGRGRLHFVCPSHLLLDRFMSDWEVGEHRVHLIPNGVELEAFRLPPPPSRPFTIGTVGAMRAEKRFDRLIEVFARLRAQLDAKLLIVGDGPERASLEELAAKMGVTDSIEFPGMREDIPAQLAKMDVFALTSDTEQMPISLVEAMAASLPAVTTDVGDIRLILPSECYWLIHGTEDIDAMTGTLLRLAKDENLRHQMGAANRLRAEASYGLDGMVDAYRKLITSLIKK